MRGDMSYWLLYRAGPRMMALRAPDHGPFSRCSATGGHHGGLIAMPVNPPPPGFTFDERIMPKSSIWLTPPAGDSG